MDSIFKNKPEKWGLRGDAVFWNEIAGAWNGKDDLEAFIKSLHLLFTGEELTPTSMGYSEMLGQEGMSSGYISGRWWTETGIPLLIKRLEVKQ